MRSRVFGAARSAGVPAAGALAVGVLAAWTASPAVAVENRTAAPYAVSGTPAKGATTGCADAPLLKPGRYVDDLVADRDLFYRVDKRGDQVLEVSASAVLAQKVYAGSDLTVGAGWGEGNQPESWLVKTDNAAGGPNVLSVGARSNDKAVGGTSACIRIGNGIEPTEGATWPFKVEVVIGLVAPDAVPGTGAGAAAKADDGFSFAGARRVPDSGTARGSVAIGEFPFWRVDLRAGQTLSVRAALEIPADLAAGPQAEWAAHIYTPLRAAADCPAEAGDPRRVALSGGVNRAELRCGPWTVEPEKETYQTTYNLPGTYYIVLGVRDAKDAARGQVVPYELQATVDGVGFGVDPRAANASATAQDEGAADAPQAASDDGGNDSTDTVLMATAAGSALVSVASLGMHIRARRALRAQGAAEFGHPARGTAAAALANPGKPGKFRRLAKPRKSRPMRLPADLLPGSLPAPGGTPVPGPGPAHPAAAPPGPPEQAAPPNRPQAPRPKKRLSPPPLSIPPNHNALDSVWSISVVLGEDEDGAPPAPAPAPGSGDDEVPDTTCGQPAINVEPPQWDPALGDPRHLPTWRPGNDA